MHTLVNARPPQPQKLGLVAVLVFALSACGGSGGDGDASAAPYEVDRAIGLSDAGTGMPQLDTRSAASVASSASLLVELADEIDDSFDDLDEWFRRGSGACRGGGSVGVSEQAETSGAVTRTLVFDRCVEDDDLLDGRVMLSCATAGCAGDGRIVFGVEGTAFVEQDLDSGASISQVLLGEVRFEDFDPARDNGRFTLNLASQFEDREGVIGEARFDGLVYETNETSRRETRRYAGNLAHTAFRTRSGMCVAAGSTAVASPQALIYDDDIDRTVSGQLTLGVDGGVAWTLEGVNVTAADGSQNFDERAFDAICEF